MSQIRVHKLNEKGQIIWHYEGKTFYRDAVCVQVEAFFGRDDYVLPYHTFRRGDRMLEWFYNDRWYNVFEMYDVDDGRLKGWYCNITRPARLEDNAIFAEDLALDVMVYPDGRYVVLDEDEFEALELDQPTRQQALKALDALLGMIQRREDVFRLIENAPKK